MDSTKKEYPVVYVYMLESIDGKASGEVLNAPASLFGKNYYFSHQYSYGSKSILLGRSTFEIFLGWIKAGPIDYTGITTEKIEKKDYLSENRNKTEYYYKL